VRPPVLVALDLPTAEEAVRMAAKVRDHVAGFKVGLGLLHGPGPGTVTALAELGLPVFADAKLHDIPSQVERAARQLGSVGARWVTAHAGGGRQMLEAAVAGMTEGSAGTGGVLGVTVLTSLDDADLAAIGVARTPGRLVSRMARVVDAAGCEGVVCSPLELGVVAEVAPRLAKVTPGIRPEGAEQGDQSRTATPVEAIRRGADYLVVGRPITSADDPAVAAATIAALIEAATSGKST
jgi:orotidine-5'-phosphate decarboxylase